MAVVRERLARRLPLAFHGTRAVKSFAYRRQKDFGLDSYSDNP